MYCQHGVGETTLNYSINTNLKNEMYKQESNDPLLLLVKLEHVDFDAPIYLVDNTEDIVSRGNTYLAFPMRIILPENDGESVRETSITFDNVSRELIKEMRKITTAITMTIETVLASDPDYVQISYADMKLKTITYNDKTITGKILFDSFLNVTLPSETYTPLNFRGIF